MTLVTQEAILIGENFLSDRTHVAVDMSKHFVGNTSNNVAIDLYQQKFVNSMTVFMLKMISWSTSVSNPLTSTVNIHISDEDLIYGEEFTIVFRDYFFEASSSNIPINLNIYTKISGQGEILIKQIVWTPTSGSFNNLANAGEMIRILYSKDGLFKLLTSKFR